jgi:hypothetical protein
MYRKEKSGSLHAAVKSGSGKSALWLLAVNSIDAEAVFPLKLSQAMPFE